MAADDTLNREEVLRLRRKAKRHFERLDELRDESERIMEDIRKTDEPLERAMEALRKMGLAPSEEEMKDILREVEGRT